MNTILDCYTDEPSGLGVPPYLGTYPRYLFGALDNPTYITIDDLRLHKYYNSKRRDETRDIKTKIKVHNLTVNYNKINDIIKKTKNLIVVGGVHTPGKYLSGIPGTLYEISELIKGFRYKILTGPAVKGSRLEGGKFPEKLPDVFDIIDGNYLEINNYNKIKDYAIKGVKLLKQIPSLRVIEIETSHGCDIGKCSFCTEPLKHSLEFRDVKDIVNEIKALMKYSKYFRIGKQSCFYTYPKSIELLKKIHKLNPTILHIDNVNPSKVITPKGVEITKAIVKYCTSGNIAAFGVESFDKEVIKSNRLNTSPEIVLKAIEIINRYGAERENGISKFLPGINILLGLKDETKQTFEKNYFYLKKILDSGLLIRRINIREVALFENTYLFNTVGNKFLKKNKKHYWKFRNKIRQEIDSPMLKKIVPEGTILKNVRMEIYDGNTTFGRQIGTYPLIVGVKKRIQLDKFYNVKIVGHMLRSVVGQVI